MAQGSPPLPPIHGVTPVFTQSIAPFQIHTSLGLNPGPLHLLTLPRVSQAPLSPPAHVQLLQESLLAITPLQSELRHNPRKTMGLSRTRKNSNLMAQDKSFRGNHPCRPRSSYCIRMYSLSCYSYYYKTGCSTQINKDVVSYLRNLAHDLPCSGTFPLLAIQLPRPCSKVTSSMRLSLTTRLKVSHTAPWVSLLHNPEICHPYSPLGCKGPGWWILVFTLSWLYSALRTCLTQSRFSDMCQPKERHRE